MCDFAGACDTATVTITVDPVNDPPTADDDFAFVDQDTPRTIDVQANDGDVDGDALTTLADRSAVERHRRGEPGRDRRVHPGRGLPRWRLVHLRGVRPEPVVRQRHGVHHDQRPAEPPDAVDDSAVTDEDTPVTVDVLGNDSDPEGDLDDTSVTVTSGPANGSTSR